MHRSRAAKIFGDKEDPRVRLQVLLGGTPPPSGGQPPESALLWATDVLRRTGNTTADVMTQVRDLRDADPRLTLKAATFLARHPTNETRRRWEAAASVPSASGFLDRSSDGTVRPGQEDQSVQVRKV